MLRATTRPPIKHRRIVERLRQDIVRGRYGPGCRLPTRVELETEFEVSTLTVQRALDHLAREGYVYAQAGRGTFVAPYPPHLARYALVFMDAYAEYYLSWSPFFMALIGQARLVTEQGGRSVAVYYGVDGRPGSEGYRKLFEDVESDRLAGLVFACNPYLLYETPLLRKPGLPRVALMAPPHREGLPLVYPDLDSFVDRAVEHFAVRGRRRLGVVAATSQTEARTQRIFDQAAMRGLRTERYWVQGAHAQACEWAANATELLMRSARDDRPDALLVTDDTLESPALHGLAAAGLHAGEDVDVVALANFPCPSPSPPGVRRLGVDSRVLMARCLELIDLQRRGQPFPAETLLPAVFESEVSSLAV